MHRHSKRWDLTSASPEDFSCLGNKNKAPELYWVSVHYLTLHFDDLTWPCLSQTSLSHPCSAHVDTEALWDLDPPPYALLNKLWKSCLAHLSATASALQKDSFSEKKELWKNDQQVFGRGEEPYFFFFKKKQQKEKSWSSIVILAINGRETGWQNRNI